MHNSKLTKPLECSDLNLQKLIIREEYHTAEQYCLAKLKKSNDSVEPNILDWGLYLGEIFSNNLGALTFGLRIAAKREMTIEELEVVYGCARKIFKADYLQKIATLQAKKIYKNIHKIVITVQCFLDLKQYAHAEKFAKVAVNKFPNETSVLLLLAIVYRRLGKSDRAIPLLKRAILIKETGGLHNNLGNTYRDVGDFTSAGKHYLKCIELEPNFAASYYNYLNVAHGNRDARDIIAKIDALLLGNKTVRGNKSDLYFAKFSYLDNKKQFRKAFEALSYGNKLKYQGHPYDEENSAKIIAKLKRDFPAKGISYFGKSYEGPTPIFIVGLPRSGTTLLEQILGCHSSVQACGELEALTNAILATDWNSCSEINGELLTKIGNSYIDEVSSLKISSAYFVDKMPGNFRWIGFIRQCFPNAPIIHVKRDKRAVAWSIFRSNFALDGNYYSNSLDSTISYIKAHDNIMAHWYQHYGSSIITVDYDKLVLQPKSLINYLLTRCSLGNDSKCYNPHLSTSNVTTASAEQVRRPIYKGSSDKWRDYWQQLGYLRPDFFLSNIPAEKHKPIHHFSNKIKEAQQKLAISHTARAHLLSNLKIELDRKSFK